MFYDNFIYFVYFDSPLLLLKTNTTHLTLKLLEIFGKNKK